MTGYSRHFSDLVPGYLDVSHGSSGAPQAPTSQDLGSQTASTLVSESALLMQEGNIREDFCAADCVFISLVRHFMGAAGGRSSGPGRDLQLSDLPHSWEALSLAQATACDSGCLGSRLAADLSKFLPSRMSFDQDDQVLSWVEDGEVGVEGVGSAAFKRRRTAISSSRTPASRRMLTSLTMLCGRALALCTQELREKRAKESLKKGVARRGVECWALASVAAAKEVAGAQGS